MRAHSHAAHRATTARREYIYIQTRLPLLPSTSFPPALLSNLPYRTHLSDKATTYSTRLPLLSHFPASRLQGGAFRLEHPLRRISNLDFLDKRGGRTEYDKNDASVERPRRNLSKATISAVSPPLVSEEIWLRKPSQGGVISCVSPGVIS